MKALAGLALAALTALGIVGLAELTQNRPDPVVAGSATVVAFDVATRDYRGGDETAAHALWAITPAIGENGRKRLVGCLEDGTLDRVMGHVSRVSVT